MNTRAFGSVGLVGFGIQGMALVAIHLLRTDYDAGAQFVSGYANGPHSWVLHLGAAASVAGTLALLGGLRSADLAPGWSAPFLLLCIDVAMRPVGFLFPVDLEAAFAGGGAPRFTTAGWVHAIAGMVAGVSVMLAILLVTVRLVRSRRLRGSSWALVVLCVLGPACYGAMLATPPGTFPSGLYQRLFIGCTWLWFVGVCAGLISGSWVGTPGAEGREPGGRS